MASSSNKDPIRPRRVLFLASGRGSNFQKLSDAILSGRIPNAEIAGLICNVENAPVLELAKQRNIHSRLLVSNFNPSERSKFDEELLSAMNSLTPDWICLAGYELILSKKTVGHFANKILNIHPSLLPSFPGLHAQKKALEYGVKWTGCTVHLVTEGVDEGPILEQSVLSVLEGETSESLSLRLLEIEHKTYVATLAKVVNQPFSVLGRKIVWK